MRQEVYRLMQDVEAGFYINKKWRIVLANPINKILDDVAEELFRATQKFPKWPSDPLHALAVVGEEFGELTQATLQCVYEPHKSDLDDIRKEAIQSMAMHLRFILSLDADAYKPYKCDQHKQVV